MVAHTTFSPKIEYVVPSSKPCLQHFHSHKLSIWLTCAVMHGGTHTVLSDSSIQMNIVCLFHCSRYFLTALKVTCFDILREDICQSLALLFMPVGRPTWQPLLAFSHEILFVVFWLAEAAWWLAACNPLLGEPWRFSQRMFTLNTLQC